MKNRLKVKYFNKQMIVIYFIAFIIASIGATAFTKATGMRVEKGEHLVQNEVSGYEYTKEASVQKGKLTDFKFTNKRDEGTLMFYELVDEEFNAVIYRSQLIPYEQTCVGGPLLAEPTDRTSNVILKVYVVDAKTREEISQSDMDVQLIKEVSE